MAFSWRSFLRLLLRTSDTRVSRTAQQREVLDPRIAHAEQTAEDQDDFALATDWPAFVAAVQSELGVPIPGRLIPSDRAWHRLNPYMWGSGTFSEDYLCQAARRRITEIAPADYGLLGFFGHGANSYAFYLGFRMPRLLVHLRWGFGGAYSDVDSQRSEIAQNLARVAAAIEWAAADVCELALVDVMGEGEVVWAGRDGRLQAISLGDFYAGRMSSVHPCG